MKEKIIEVLDKMRPYMNSHGGDLEFIDYQDKVVYINLSGVCGTCPHQNETLQNGLLRALQAEIPEVENLINVEL